jgi:predicted ATPase
LISSCGKLLRDLFDRCPGLQALATSRRLLQLSELPEERSYPLATLPVPDASAELSAVQANESVKLFQARAGAGFAVTAENADSVAGLCRALDGIPLAIELAAARLGVRSVQQMNKESRALLTLLEGVEVDDLRHWHTLHAALEWSYELLSDPLRDFLRPLAVFDGGWTESAAASIYGAHLKDAESAAGLLQELLNNSLVISRVAKDVTRFRMLEPVRQFVREKLTPAETDEYERKHAEIFTVFCGEDSPELLGADQVTWLARIQEDFDNVRAAFRWSVARKDAQAGLRLFVSIWRFMEIRGFFTEGRQRAQEVLAMAGVEDYPALLREALSGAGWLAYRQGDFTIAEQLTRRALALAEQLRDDGWNGQRFKRSGQHRAHPRRLCPGARVFESLSGDGKKAGQRPDDRGFAL